MSFLSAVGGGVDASGGTTVIDRNISGEDYRIHAFENVGSDTFTVDSGGEVDVLVVGGGGGGGGFGGGGGAGGVVDADVTINDGTYSITVGEGGPGDSTREADNTTGFDGEDSTAFGLTALGGGGGGSRDDDGINGTDGRDGGSGGGGAHTNDPPQRDPGSSIQPTFSNATVFGNRGGFGLDTTDFSSDPNHGAGGGGGATQVGGDAIGGSTGGGFGGDGVDLSSKYTTEFGDNGAFAGGGGAMVYQDVNYVPPGGVGGGGNGGSEGTANATDGEKNTGGGGGGGAWSNHPVRGDGGSGIVLIRYEI